MTVADPRPERFCSPKLAKAIRRNTESPIRIERISGAHPGRCTSQRLGRQRNCTVPSGLFSRRQTSAPVTQQRSPQVSVPGAQMHKPKLQISRLPQAGQQPSFGMHFLPHFFWLFLHFLLFFLFLPFFLASTSVKARRELRPPISPKPASQRAAEAAAGCGHERASQEIKSVRVHERPPACRRWFDYHSDHSGDEGRSGHP